MPMSETEPAVVEACARIGLRLVWMAESALASTCVYEPAFLERFEQAVVGSSIREAVGDIAFCVMDGMGEEKSAGV